ncbi:gastrin-releasing peptide [Latimeria chalumnae]|uniref:Gastrin-releasing peptide n=1 Tax=Latimeria chalumnae TaxID=7897 RepID=M3XKD6_LATCH|eukprot:XP_014349884.1 PREDICTED: gastrin-releasing peptide [Latimeria chalumnae]
MGCEFLFWKYRSLFSLIVMSIVISRVQFGTAVPVQQNVAPLSKIYPRGSHWAVGHLMGKKSIADFPYNYEGEDKVLYSPLPEDAKQIGGYQQRVESLKNLLRLLEGVESRDTQLLKEEFSMSNKKPFETEDSKILKDVVDYLLQLMNTKENSPS